MGLRCLVVIFVSVVLVASKGNSQGLGELASQSNLGFGFLVTAESLDSQAYRDVVLSEATVATVTAYWKIQTRPRSGVFDFSGPDKVVEIAVENNLELHGHPLLWAHDDFIPRWVKRIRSAQDAENTLREHIETTVGRYRGAVSLWHVVNEAFDYTGELRDSFWRRKLGDDFIATTFAIAHESDPTVRLIYNDFGLLEIDNRKYEAVKTELVRMRENNVSVHGLGWQMHLTPQQVLADTFPMASRMAEMSGLGFTNYITELDIKLPSNTPENLALQAAAYRKIAETFLGVTDRGSLQTWDVSDRQSWLGTEAAPLLFDENYAEKPAYYELLDLLLPEVVEPEGGDPDGGDPDGGDPEGGEPEGGEPIDETPPVDEPSDPIDEEPTEDDPITDGGEVPGKRYGRNPNKRR